MLNKDILGERRLSDKEISVLVALMRYKFVNNTFAYSKKYLYDYLGVSNNNTVTRNYVDNAFNSLCDKGYISIRSVSDINFITINEIVYVKPFLQIHYKDVNKIFSCKDKIDKFKMLLVYLNIIKWFRGDDGYSFTTNERLMLECNIKSEMTLMKIQDCLIELDLFVMKTHTFEVCGEYTTKNFYGESFDAIDRAIDMFTDNLSLCGNVKKINQENTNKRRSEIMKIEHRIRKGIINKKEGNKLKEEIRNRYDNYLPETNEDSNLNTDIWDKESEDLFA